MKLTGWRRLSPTELVARGHSPKSERYETPTGGDVAKRTYLNAQAKSVGFKSYAEYTREANKPMYQKILAASPNPKEIRKLDSAFNSAWAKTIHPRLESGGRIGKDMWHSTLDAADIDRDNDIFTRYPPGG